MDKIFDSKILRTIFPVIIGYFTFIISTNLFDKIFKFNNDDDFDWAAIVGILQIIFTLVFIVVLFIVQYKIIVPRTFKSTKRLLRFFLIFGFIISFLISLLNLDNSLRNYLVIFTRFFINIESFFLTNIFVIFLMNHLSNQLKSYESSPTNH